MRKAKSRYDEVVSEVAMDPMAGSIVLSRALA